MASSHFRTHVTFAHLYRENALGVVARIDNAQVGIQPLDQDELAETSTRQRVASTDSLLIFQPLVPRMTYQMST